MKNEILKQLPLLDNFPRFEDGQILSSEDLNGTFDYLEKQIRSTRTLFFGHGIISGFNYFIEKNIDGPKSIVVEAGKAVTSEGAIIDLSKKMEYRYYVSSEYYREDKDVTVNNYVQNNQIPNDYILLKEKIDENCQELTKFEDIEGVKLEEYIVGLFVKEYEETASCCSGESCNIQKTSTKRVCGAFLKRYNQKEKKENNTNISIPRLTNVINSRELSVFLRKISDCFYYNIQKIKKHIDDLQFYEKEKSYKLIEKLNSIRFNTENAAPYISFLFDLSNAFNELVDASDANMLDSELLQTKGNVIVLGKIFEKSKGEEERDSFKETFRDYDQINKRMVWHRQLERLKNMILCFNPDNVYKNLEEEKITFYPVWKNRKLGEQPIPSYYSTTESSSLETLEEYWDAHNYIHIDKAKDENVNKNYMNLGNNTDFFLINSYPNLKVDVFKEKINQLIRDYNLPVFFVGFDLCGKRESFTLENYDKSSIPDITETDFRTCFSNLSEIQYPNKDADEDAKKYAISSDKLSIAEEILRLYYPDCNINQSGKDFEQLTNSELESLRQAVYLFIKEKEIEEKEKNAAKHILSFLIRSIVYNLEEEKKLEPKIRHGVEYNGGVSAHNVLVALCYNDRVILCLDLNYLDYINCKDDFIPLLDIESEGIDLNGIFGDSIEIKISPKKTTCDVILASYVKCKIKVRDYIRKDKGIAMFEAEKLMESADRIIYSNIFQERANAIKQDLEELGATVNVKKIKQ